ncbi:MAG: hypothetical protein U1G08_08910 [Verrucomicrobiota bacterium]
MPTSLEPIGIICPESPELEKFVLENFQFPPVAGDLIRFSGQSYQVVRREFETNCGSLDNSTKAKVVLKLV